MKTILTIVTITKDDYTGLARTIKSTKWLRAKYPVTQLVIDSSKPEIAAINLKLAESNQIEYLYQPPQGIYPAMNTGLKNVASDWIWFLNGGDCLHPQFPLEHLVIQLKLSEADGCIYQIEQDGKIHHWPPFKEMLPFPSLWIPHPGTILRTSILKSLNGFSSKYSIASDGELWYRLIESNAKLDLIRIPIVQFASAGASANHKKTSKEVFSFIASHWIKLFMWWLGRGLTLYRIPKHFYAQSKA